MLTKACSGIQRLHISRQVVQYSKVNDAMTMTAGTRQPVHHDVAVMSASLKRVYSQPLSAAVGDARHQHLIRDE